MITYLPRVIAAPAEPSGIGGPDHPMRAVTREVAFESGGWDRDRRAKVSELFDMLAGEWHTRITPQRHEPLHDALDRGLDGVAVADATCLEVGSGTGDSTPILAARFGMIVALDLAGEMLRLAPADAAPRVQSDAADLPFPDGQIDIMCLINALLFPIEVDRLLRPSGCVVWVNTSGDRTPIHLPAEDVVAALPGAWNAIASEAGNGTWCVARRG